MTVQTHETTPIPMAGKAALWPAELDILFHLGPWETPDQVLAAAIEALLEKNPELRRAVAVALYQRGHVTLSRAAEIAGIDQWAFRDHLRERDIPMIVQVLPAAEMDAMNAAYDRKSRQ